MTQNVMWNRASMLSTIASITLQTISMHRSTKLHKQELS